MKKSGLVFICFCFILTGCLAGNGNGEGNQTKQVSEELSQIEEPLAEELSVKETLVEEESMELLFFTIRQKTAFRYITRRRLTPGGRRVLPLK